MSRLKNTFGRPLAIRHDDALLHVPNMHPQTPSHIRVRVFELVLRRQWGEAVELAVDTADWIERRARQQQQLDALMRQTPHRNRRGLGMAA